MIIDIKTSDLLYAQLSGPVYCLLKDLRISYNDDGVVESFTIKKSFISDGASVPRFLIFMRFYLNTVGLRAAIVHDYMYDRMMGRRKADDVFYALLIESEVNSFIATLAWVAVRLFGKSHYPCLLGG